MPLPGESEGTESPQEDEKNYAMLKAFFFLADMRRGRTYTFFDEALCHVC